MRSASIQHTLGAFLNVFTNPRCDQSLNRRREAFTRCTRPWESVVHHATRITIIAFQATTHRAHPSVVKLGMQHAKMVERGIGDKKHQVAAQGRRLHESKRNITATLGRHLRHQYGRAFCDYLRAKMFWRVRSLSGLGPLRSQAIFANRRNTLTAFRQRVKLRRGCLA